MPTVPVKTVAGGESGSVELDEHFFGVEPNGALLHQVVTAQLAARRAGTQSTKTRAEVRGGGAKPWRQKGTGRARHGSIRSPQWRGGGVALGPKPRSYAQKTPKKMIRLALRSALSDRAADGKIIVIDGWGFDGPKTKDAMAKLEALGADGRVLVVLDRSDEAGWLSFRNLQDVHTITTDQLNSYDVLVADTLIFTTDTLPTLNADDRADPSAAADEGAAAATTPDADTADDDEPTILERDDIDSDADGVANVSDETPFGAGSAMPLDDGSAPSPEFVVKGNADSMLYHPPESPFYSRTTAEVWFESAEAAEAAGFQLPPSMRADEQSDDDTADGGSDTADGGGDTADGGGDTADGGGDTADGGGDTADGGSDTADGGGDTADEADDGEGAD